MIRNRDDLSYVRNVRSLEIMKLLYILYRWYKTQPQTALVKMIYESSKYAKICEENVSEVFIPCVFRFVGDVTECLAVSRRFVPDNYVTTATILRVVKKKHITTLFT